MTYVNPHAMSGIVDDMLAAGDSQYSIGDLVGAMMNAAQGIEVASSALDGATASGSPSISQADFVSTGGICKASNLTALTYVKTLQKQLNRVASVKGFGKIAIDGAVGPGTLGLFRQVQGAAGKGAIMGDPSSCIGVAADADVLLAQVQAYADSLGAPAVVLGAPSFTQPTIVTKDGKEKSQAGVWDTFSGMSGLEQIAVVGVFGAIGYLVFTGKKKRRK